jgi:TPR repeat protein
MFDIKLVLNDDIKYIDQLQDIISEYFFSEPLNKSPINNNIYYYCLQNINNSNCKYIISIIYYNGYGVYKDIEKAKYWLGESLKENNKFAQYEMGKWFEDGILLTNIYHIKEASKWYKKSCQQEYAKAQYSLALLFKNYTTNKIDDSLSLFKKSEEQGNIKAMIEIAHIYNEVYKDKNIALNWYMKSYNNGENNAKKYINTIINENIDIYIENHNYTIKIEKDLNHYKSKCVEPNEKIAS